MYRWYDKRNDNEKHQELFNQIFDLFKIYFFQYVNQAKKVIPIIIGVLLYPIAWESFIIQFYINALKKIQKSRKFSHQHSTDCKNPLFNLIKKKTSKKYLYSCFVDFQAGPQTR